MAVRILVGSMMIFFGTLLLAGLLALGQPGGAGIQPIPPTHYGMTDNGGGGEDERVVDELRRLVALLGAR
ncbi:hypothetical protein JI739_07265 [Ramlibacter sp. AW1]|uniref:Uncharacterized protein n=1 Tax=Ramlibacter aurantiacus TaxID=2801330 RepID=A0A936ZEM7_9BURK|nr:hypothetical protein [Ramlibacter aurantiacus]MBL0420144.1 hypothetical protein [Ramlibacter aurantiacus]